MLVRVDDLAAGADTLRSASFAVERVDGFLRVAIDPTGSSVITRTLAEAGQWVTELRPHRFSLEDIFLELTSTSEEVAA
jgi:hypothetical protein